MCGIYGIYNFASGKRVSSEELEKMDKLIFHRGPDDNGRFCDGPLGIGMRRLSIIDLSTGHQPIYNEDSSIWIVFNGEIYNFQQLRSELQAKGHVFSTKSDTEVIVHLYEDMGRDCVKKLRGMFAFALWDGRNKKFMLARDRVGKKPLNYMYYDGRIVFSSELRAVMSVEGVPSEIDYKAMDMFLALQYIPSPLTIYKNVYKLPPAHTLMLENGNLSIEPYWDLPVNQPKPKISFGEAKEAIVSKLKEATKIRMISDVPLGAFLSGGVDSSVIVALMSELSSEPVKTFSIGFEEQEFSEVEYAREVAQMYGCDHREFCVKAEMAEILPKLAWHYSEPFADPSALPSYYVAHETRKHVTVALNGDGGDENFAGYLRYIAMKTAHYWDYLPAPIRATIAKAAELLPERTAPVDIMWRAKRFLRSTVFSDFPSRHMKMVSYLSEEDKRELYTSGMYEAVGGRTDWAKQYIGGLYGRCQQEDFVNRLLYVDVKSYLPECLMAKIDIATMANSLEGRSPLLDHEFMELCFSLDSSWKLKGLGGAKWIFKEAFADKLPRSIKKRGKMGFGIPLGPWFRGGLKNYWEEHCLSSDAMSRGYFDKAALSAMWQEHQSGKRDNGFKLWGILMLELWHETFKNDARLH